MTLQVPAPRSAILSPISFVKSLIAAVEENRKSARRLISAIDSCVSIETVGKVTQVAQGVAFNARDHSE